MCKIDLSSTVRIYMYMYLRPFAGYEAYCINYSSLIPLLFAVYYVRILLQYLRLFAGHGAQCILHICIVVQNFGSFQAMELMYNVYIRICTCIIIVQYLRLFAGHGAQLGQRGGQEGGEEKGGTQEL